MTGTSDASDVFGKLSTAEAIIDNGRFGTRTVRFETGQLAKQAAGSAVVYLDDDTMLLSATTASNNPRDHLDFFPLTVDVEERDVRRGQDPRQRCSAARAGPAEAAILTCRLIDRPLRPTFVKGLATRSRSSSRCWRSTPTGPLRRRGHQRGLDVDPARRPAVLRPGRRRRAWL